MDKQGVREWWPPEWPDWPQEERPRQVVSSLFDIGLMILDADASRRKDRMEKAEKETQARFSRMTVQDQQMAPRLVDIWERNALLKQRIRWKGNREGLEAVRQLRPQWYTAAFKMDKAVEEALRLGHDAHEYFSRRLQQFYITQEERDDCGNYHNYPDYSELREQWYSHKSITVGLPWAWEEMLLVCKQYEPKVTIKRHLRKPTVWELLSLAIGIVSLIVGIVSGFWDSPTFVLGMH